MTPQELQQLENAPALRIKFASMQDDGNLAPDSTSDYPPFFSALAAEVVDWVDDPSTQPVQTRSEHQRPAHVLRHGTTEIAAVEHETGIEVIVAGVAVNVASAALIGLATWSWKKWAEVRKKQQVPGFEKAEPALVLESVKEKSIDGRPKETVQIERRGPLSAEKVGEHIRQFISSVVQHKEQEVSLAGGAISMTFNFNFGR
jgi:hypothetical protein